MKINCSDTKRHLLLTLAVMVALCGRAQEQSTDDPTFAISLDTFQIISLTYYDDNMQKCPNNTQQIRTGDLEYSFKLNIKKETDQTITVPEDPNAYFYMTDADNMTINFQSSDCSSAWTHYGSGHVSKTQSHYVNTGGEYRWKFSIPSLDIVKEDTITVYDVPCMHTNVLSKYGLGSYPLQVITYNTGYPYTDNFTGEEWAKCTIYAVDDNEQLTKVSENKINLTFKQRFNEKKAVVDSLIVNIPTDKVGKYLMRLESNWEPANRDKQFEIYDPATGINHTTRDTRDSNNNYTTLTGTKVKHPTAPGIYVRGKKKVIVK